MHFSMKTLAVGGLAATLFALPTVLTFGCSRVAPPGSGEAEQVGVAREAITTGIEAGSFQHNAVYMSWDYIGKATNYAAGWLQDSPGNVGELTTLRNRGIDTLIVDMGWITNTGYISDGWNSANDSWYSLSTCSTGGYGNGSGAFLDQVYAWESANSGLAAWKVIAWFNGDLSGETTDASVNKRRINLDYWTGQDPTGEEYATRTRIGANTALYTAPGHDCTSTNRGYDGILYDFEPSGVPMGASGSQKFEGIKQTVIKARSVMGVLNGTPNNRKIGIASMPFRTATTGSGDWSWIQSQFYFLGQYVDYVVPMLYDQSKATSTDFKNWLADGSASQVDGIVDSLSRHKRGICGFDQWSCGSVRNGRRKLGL